MEPEITMTEENVPKPGTKDALKAEKAALEAEKAALEAENAALKAQMEAMKSTEAPVSAGAARAVRAAEEPVRMVTVKIPRVKKDQEDVFVRVNRRTYLIKRGVSVEVPWFVAEVLQHQEEMLDIIMEYDEQHRDKSDGNK